MCHVYWIKHWGGFRIKSLFCEVVGLQNMNKHLRVSVQRRRSPSCCFWSLCVCVCVFLSMCVCAYESTCVFFRRLSSLCMLETAPCLRSLFICWLLRHTINSCVVVRGTPRMKGGAQAPSLSPPLLLPAGADINPCSCSTWKLWSFHRGGGCG